MAIVTPIGLFFGRLANFINGELWGRPTDVPWAMIFPRGGPFPRHPSQLYQATFEGILLFALMLAVWKWTDGRRRPGLLTGVFCMGYARGPHRRRDLPRARCVPRLLLGDWLTMGMLLSLPVLAFGAWLVTRAYRNAPLPRIVTTELGRLIARRIALTGPISLADFMAEALGHPRLGYYRRALPVGAAGDFTTAPEISQMFGELIGAWLAERWLAMGRPSAVRLVELGPGRGTLMADALRATRGVPGFHAALDLHLVETNAPLRACSSNARSPASSPPGTRASTTCPRDRCCWSPTSSSMPCRCASSRRPRTAGASAWSAWPPTARRCSWRWRPA